MFECCFGIIIVFCVLIHDVEFPPHDRVFEKGLDCGNTYGLDCQSDACLCSWKLDQLEKVEYTGAGHLRLTFSIGPQIVLHTRSVDYFGYVRVSAAVCYSAHKRQPWLYSC